MASNFADDIADRIEEAFPGERIYILPPEDVRLVYPCWIIEYKHTKGYHGDNRTIFLGNRFKITHITKDCVELDSVGKVLRLFQRISKDGERQVFDGLSHDYYTIYC